MSPQRKSDPQLTLFELPRHADTVRDAREAKGLSLHAVARAAGVDAATVLRIERDEQAPSRETLQAITSAMAGLEGEELELVRLGIERGSVEHLRDLVPCDGEVAWEPEDDDPPGLIADRTAQWALSKGGDPVVRYVVKAHPGGASVEQVGEALHLGATAVQEAYYSALRKLREVAGTNTPEGDELEWLRERLLELLEARDGHENAWDLMVTGKDEDHE